jgi:hypothetical protein
MMAVSFEGERLEGERLEGERLEGERLEGVRVSMFASTGLGKIRAWTVGCWTRSDLMDLKVPL